MASMAGGAPRTFPEVGSRAVFVAGMLLFVRDGTLMAQQFDPSTGLKGHARAVIEDLHYFRSTGQASFSVSQNGILAWRARRPASRLVWLDRNGMELETVATAVFDANGRLSADGKRYVVGVIDPKQGVSDLWVYDFERQSSERATFSMVDEKAPIWADAGGTIYYRSDGGSGPPDIWMLRRGEHRGSIVYRGPTVEEPKDVSPDGKWLLYASFFVEGSDLHARPLDGQGESREVAATPFNETSPRFSPDGRWVAYSSDLSGRPEIYIRPFPDAGPAVRLSRDGGTRPRWRRDGKELYYLGPEGRVMVIAVDRSFAAPRLLFHAPTASDFEPAPDGSRFLAQLQPRSTAPAVRLLVNWQRRLER